MPSSPHPDQVPSAGGAAPGPRSPDWERIELDYRAGIKSLREIAEGSGTSHVNISKRAKKLGWTRDLTAKIQSKADALVNAALVNTPVNNASPAAERETVEAAASTQASVRLGQREDIERCRRINMGLMDELEQQSASPELFAEVAAILRSAPAEELTKEQRGKLAEAAGKASSLANRSSTMRSLSESLRVLIGLERQAYGIRDEMPEPPAKGMESVTTAELLAMRDAVRARA
ncbi:hypothetical protein CLV01_3351 [Delftia sp. 60]|uniref:hypothetical protein n=1 Tax=Delftia sp. 60 TaxID=2035216 RepID=UPI000C390BD1|nr:hypothetical protein [Delftia sp. 60]PIF37870.1 hypothetical protein CLU98_3098 [Burkholderiales bacterium 23]PIF66949.1 hypothetical protein CLV01_3351 [Delftia sp. 60]